MIPFCQYGGTPGHLVSHVTCGVEAMEHMRFSPASEGAMIAHMNAEHADANLLYVQVYGHLGQATAARLLALDKDGMELDVTLPEGTTRLRLPFDHRLHDEHDAERTLVAMARYAQGVRTPTIPPPAGREDGGAQGELSHG
jgi:putative heme iron utilization protein